ncbi:MAG: tetratricopeptide repeat protein [Phycisphaera sp.]|nr:tetratricopeptide repeat protein [Phycisphaera sp.]
MTVTAAMNLLEQALEAYSAHRLDTARERCQKFLKDQPRHAQAWHLLAVIELAHGDPDAALRAANKAAGLGPRHAEFFHTLGLVHKALGQSDAAIGAYRKAIELNPELAPSLNNLGNLLRESGGHGEAVVLLRRAVALCPSLTEAHNNLASSLRQLGQHEQALHHYREALRADPDNPVARENLAGAFAELAQRHLDRGAAAKALEAAAEALRVAPDHVPALIAVGNALVRVGRPTEAVRVFERGIELDARHAGVHVGMGNALHALGRIEEAAQSVTRALEIDPTLTIAHNNLGNLHAARGDMSQAEACYRRALELDSHFCDALNNLAGVLVELDRRSDAIGVYRRLLELNPHQPDAHSNLIFNLDLDPDTTADQQLREKLRWDEVHAQPLSRLHKPFDNNRNPDRPLRVGYVSADFRKHSAAAAFGPVVLNHNRENIQTFLYSNAATRDRMTERFESAGVFRKIVGHDDARVSELIRGDGIDILVDLSGHSAFNRLTLFALKPAPVQVTAWGLAVGTGLSAMDYLFTDASMVPEGEEHLVRETPWRLPCVLAFEPPCDAPEPRAKPDGDAVVFGCMNRFSKVTTPMLRLWASLLRRVPKSRLLLKAVSLNDEVSRRRVTGVMREEGVDPARIELLGGTTHVEHLATFNRIDVLLDPFPQTGGVSLLEGLWMGTPSVTLRGGTLPSRAGSALLAQAGLPHCVAHNTDGYVQIAATLANDRHTLANLKTQLRDRLLNAPVCDRVGYVNAVESAYRQMWRKWLDGS